MKTKLLFANTKLITLLISAVIIVATFTTLLVVFLPGRQHPSPPSFDWEFPSNSTFYQDYGKVTYMVPSTDGTGLATDVYLPLTINKSLPVIFVRTPYGKDQLNPIASYTYDNYVVVVQDFRGFYESEGEITLPFNTEKTDGQATLLWITEQPWCNGKIGTWGPSALGIAQYLMAPNATESLVCQLPMVATPSSYDAAFRGGVLRNELIVPWMEANGFPPESFDMLKENEKYNSMWYEGSIESSYSDIHAASIHLGGWYDIFTQETINAYQGYQYKGGQNALGNAKLIMGPWVHAGMMGAPTGDITFPNQDIGVMLKATDAIMSKWLKDNSTLWDQLPTVAFYLMSSLEYNPSLQANRWYQSPVWPVPFTTDYLYLHSNFSLLEGESTSIDDSLWYLYDPNDPVPTVGGGNLALPAGIYDQQSVEIRDDVLSFSTEPLLNPLTIIGQLNISLFISSNCTDTDFSVKLTDVYPDNRSMLITDTIIRARNRDRLDDWDFLTPGTVYEITFPLDSTAYHLNVGHKLRVDISSSNYPRFLPNPNTGEALWANTTTLVANNSIYVNALYPSKITIPSVDYQSLVSFNFRALSLSFNPLIQNKKSLREDIPIQQWKNQLTMIYILVSRFKYL